jgi:hypothetical protein
MFLNMVWYVTRIPHVLETRRRFFFFLSHLVQDIVPFHLTTTLARLGLYYDTSGMYCMSCLERRSSPLLVVYHYVLLIRRGLGQGEWPLEWVISYNILYMARNAQLSKCQKCT